ncbi:MAG: hypothetical protein JW910_13735, partial [Anaerolineae bacterium]|nr:hypothetical protein [Anaerolineae bacterium]
RATAAAQTPPQAAEPFARSERLVRDIRHWRQFVRQERLSEQEVRRLVQRQVLTRETAETLARQEGITRQQVERILRREATQRQAVQRVETVITPARRIYRQEGRPAPSPARAELPVPPGYTAAPEATPGATGARGALPLPDVNTLTEQVIRQIDRRIQAQRERLGGD